MLEYICKKKGKNLKLECNAELDTINFQVAKITQRKEARSGKRKMKIIQVPYAVFNIEELKRKLVSPRTKNKIKYKKILNAFYKYFDILENGFVVFKERYVQIIIDKLENHEELQREIDKILKELTGT